MSNQSMYRPLFEADPQIAAAIDGVQIAILAVFVQVLSPNKYVGWGLLFIWFVGSIFLSNMGYANPLYSYAGGPSVPLSDFNGAGSFWKGAAWFQSHGRNGRKGLRSFSVEKMLDEGLVKTIEYFRTKVGPLAP